MDFTGAPGAAKFIRLLIPLGGAAIGADEARSQTGPYALMEPSRVVRQVPGVSR
jgi:hypothetical protein